MRISPSPDSPRGRAVAWTLAAVGFWTIFLVAGPAVGQQNGDDPSDQKANAQRAQKAFDRGYALYEEGKYSKAIVEFRKAQQLFPHPVFLYNTAMAQMHLGNHEDATSTARRVLKSPKIGAKLKAKTLGLVDANGRVLTAGAIAERTAARRRAAEKHARQQGRRAARASVPEAFRPESLPAPEPTKPARFGTLGWVGAGVTVLGAGSLVASGVHAMSLEDDWTELERLRQDGPRSDFEDKQTELHNKQRPGKILLFTGAAVTTVGAALIATDLVTVESEPPIRAGVGPRGAFVGFQW